MTHEHPCEYPRVDRMADVMRSLREALCERSLTRDEEESLPNGVMITLAPDTGDSDGPWILGREAAETLYRRLGEALGEPSVRSPGNEAVPDSVTELVGLCLDAECVHVDAEWAGSESLSCYDECLGCRVRQLALLATEALRDRAGEARDHVTSDVRESSPTDDDDAL